MPARLIEPASKEVPACANGGLNVTERLKQLLDTGQFSDVTIQVGDGRDGCTFKAHKLLLATASQPLYKLLSNGVRFMSSDDVIRFTDVDPESFKHVLKYIYTDGLEVSNVHEGLSILKLSGKWGLTSLATKTNTFLGEYLDGYKPSTESKKNELCDFLMVTEDDSDAFELNERCWEILIEHVNEVIPCQSFLMMSEPILRKLFGHKKFRFVNQLALFEAIRDWGMNQVLQQKLSVNQFPSKIGELLQYIDLSQIKDSDFLNTILPSDCVGKADLIAFFLSRGLQVPREVASSSRQTTVSQNDNQLDYKRVCRYKRGKRILEKEIYENHEVRFRADKTIRLYGVGFGFLFSNTDLGVTIHCQGPWELHQWSDIMRTYCRVTWDNMQTADVALLFTEPVLIEASQSYKILVKIGRMTCGSGEIDLWGGTEGTNKAEHEGTSFYFLKSATNPNKEVDMEQTESNPSLITHMYYQLYDGSPPETLNGALPISPKTSVTENPPFTPTSPIPNEWGKSRFLPPKSSAEASSSYSIPRKRPSIKTDLGETADQDLSIRRKPSPEVKSYQLPWQQPRIPRDEIPHFLKPKTPTETTSSRDEIPFFLKPKTPTESTSRFGSSSYGRSSQTGSTNPYLASSSATKLADKNEDKPITSRYSTATKYSGVSGRTTPWSTPSTRSSYLSSYLRDLPDSSKSDYAATSGSTDTGSYTSSFLRRNSSTASKAKDTPSSSSTDRGTYTSSFLGRNTSAASKPTDAASSSSAHNPSYSSSILRRDSTTSARQKDNPVSRTDSDSYTSSILRDRDSFRRPSYKSTDSKLANTDNISSTTKSDTSTSSYRAPYYYRSPGQEATSSPASATYGSRRISDRSPIRSRAGDTSSSTTSRSIKQSSPPKSSYSSSPFGISRFGAGRSTYGGYSGYTSRYSSYR